MTLLDAAAPPHVRDALAAYDVAVDSARVQTHVAWERLSYKEVLAVHVRLGDAAERLCRECLERFSDEEVRGARAWIAEVVGRPMEKIASRTASRTRAESVSLAVDLWLARHERRR